MWEPCFDTGCLWEEARFQGEALASAPTRDLTPGEVAGLVEERQDWHALYAPCFQRREQREWSATYLRGLLADLPRTSLEPLVLALVGADRDAVRGLPHFVSAGPWDDDAIRQRHWRGVAQALGDDDGVLTLDGGDCPKHGRESVGVKRHRPGGTRRRGGQAGHLPGGRLPGVRQSAGRHPAGPAAVPAGGVGGGGGLRRAPGGVRRAARHGLSDQARAGRGDARGGAAGGHLARPLGRV